MAEIASDPIQLITRIRYMMEYMTLCGDPTLFEPGLAALRHPAPNGIPMGIVTLPDFVVDVAIDGIRSATATDRGHLEPLDVGGRAGRLAWLLQGFGGQRNGWYGIRYVAKAGDVGRVVLERRFAKARPGANSESVSLRYIVKSKADYDWLHVYGGDAQRVESSHVGLQVTIADIDELPYSLKDLLVDARYVVIASKYADHAIEAISVLGESLARISTLVREKQNQDPDRRIPIGLLLDLSALRNHDDAGRVVESFAELQKHASAIELDSTALCDREADFLSGHFKHILVRKKTCVQMGDLCESFRELTDRPVAREALTAGYALASACNLGWKLLRRWYRYFPCLRPIDGRPHKGYPQTDAFQAHHSALQTGLLPTLDVDAPDPISLADRIQFAAMLAQFTDTKPLHYWDLLKAVAAESRQQSLGDLEKQEVEFASIPKDRLQTWVESLEGTVGGSIHLAPRFEDPPSNSTLSLVVPLSSIDHFARSCLLRDARFEVDSARTTIDKAVMFDLDATLLDSEGLRRACWFNGLLAFFREADIKITGMEIHTVIDVYQAFVYSKYEGFHSLLRDHADIAPEWQPCDFRQVWNHPYAWATLSWILAEFSGLTQENGWQGDVWHPILQVHDGKKPGCVCDVCQDLEPLLAKQGADVEEQRKFTQRLRHYLNRFKFAIQEGRAAFWNVDYPCYPQARSCVQMLRSTPGCEVYVVTEGHEETQVHKLTCTGLGDLFPRGRVLSTGAASAAEDARSDLDKLLQQNRHALEDLATYKQHVREEARADLELPLRTRKATIGSITFLIDCLHALGKKAHRRFYSAVVDAIRQDPESPARVLQSFLVRQEETVSNPMGVRPMRFFMIGDRYGNDCQPLLKMFPSRTGTNVGVGTCRILSGKRANEDCPPEPTEEEPHPPPTMYVCDTLAQVGHIMHQASSWEGIDLVEEVTPPVLLELKNGVIHYGPKEAEGGLRDKVEELAPRFGDIAWARHYEVLQRERAVEDMLYQIERDLAVCDDGSLCLLYDSVMNDHSVKKHMERWWGEAHDEHKAAREPATIRLKGALKLLAGINWWRYRFQRRLLQREAEPKDTLEWMLAGVVLKCVSSPGLLIRAGVRVNRAQGAVPDGIDGHHVLKAIPYSNIGIEILTRLRESGHLGSNYFQTLDEWLRQAHSLPRVK